MMLGDKRWLTLREARFYSGIGIKRLKALVPRQYMIPDTAAIGRVVAALGHRASIPGVEVYEETVIAARRA